MTAGGTSVNPDGVTQPRDPNTGNASSTYGRYAGLAWSRTFSVAAGQRLECVLSGQRTDRTPPIALPTIPLVVPSVDTTRPVNGWAGNYDSGNNLDYLVHYTVSYQ